MSAGEIKTLLPDDVSPLRVFAASPPTFEEVEKAVCDHYGTPPDYYRAHGDRSATLVKNIIAFMLRRHGRMSERAISQHLGYRAKSSVMFGVLKITGRIEVEELLRDDIDIIRRRVAHAILERSAPCQ
jgi:chromosomal replication initiation ATPase DnaA